MSASSSTNDLRNRIIFTILILAVYRFGTFVPLPGIDPEQLKIMMEGNQKGLLGMFNVFAGGAVSRMAIFALGIMPYISSAIIVQLLTGVSDYFKNLKSQGETGRAKITQITRYGTVLLATVQGYGLAVGLENHFLIKTKKKHENVDREISTGAEIQSQLLPDYCPIIYGMDLAAHCRPALQLGGDYYDFMCLKTNISEKRKEKSRWAFVIGDVMGKGIPAGLLMTMLRGMLRAEVLTGLPPDRILYDLNQLAINDLDQSHRFVTLFYSDYDPRTRKLRFSNAAHNPPLLWKNLDQKIIKLDTEGFVLGIQKDAEYHCGEIKLNENDLVLYYTDGVIDTTNSFGERFDEERLIKTLTKLCKQSYTSQEILNKIFKKLDDFTGQNRNLEDDASIVIFQLK